MYNVYVVLWLISLRVKCKIFLLNNMFLLNNLKQTSEKNVAPVRARTLTSRSLGKHPNHLDHWLYMLLTVLNSPLRAYWSVPRDLDLVHCHLQWLILFILLSCQWRVKDSEEHVESVV